MEAEVRSKIRARWLFALGSLVRPKKKVHANL